MEAPTERIITSLHQGVLLLNEHPVLINIVIKVTSVETHHAPVLLQLFLKGRRGSTRSYIPSKESTSW
jgi:hypothetical protein